jgi:hypothetical protein
MESFAPLLVIGLLIVVIIVMRLVGAWMLRINEVIQLQKDTLIILKQIQNKQP